MARADPGNVAEADREIRLVKNPHGKWTARDLNVEVTAQGDTRREALKHLDAVVAAVRGGGVGGPNRQTIP